jgi:hypothetical protein
MDREKYFVELSRILAKNEIQTAPTDRNTLPILLNGFPACRVEPGGGMLKFPNDLDTPEANELYHRVAAFSHMVREYMAEIERAPVLQVATLDEDYRLLAEFNGAILAGHEMEYGYMFATWQRDYDGTGLWQGEYFLDSYTEAKLDFAVRAGLIEKQRIFTNAQLVDIYQSVNDTFETGYELSQENTKNLTKIQSQIEEILPDIKEKMNEIQRKVFENMPEQSM